MAGKVLICDDDAAICKMLQKVMTSNQLDSEIAYCGKDALDLLRNQTFDVLLIDVNLEDMEGFDVIKEIRARGISTPVIIISGRNEDYDALYGLSVGADDYVTKPFRPVVLGAKVMAVLRRNSQRGNSSASIVAGCFRYDTETLRFYKNDIEIDLSSKERSLMLLFMQNPDRVFPRELLYEKVWGNSVIIDDNSIMVYINHLRSKIEDHPQNPDYILTVRGIGYRFSAKGSGKERQ